ncbi:unnamed protein product, partial [Mesorhabditis belari]|uniref:Saposin B-type domain-containing protein n=1 Tax=Mesorhabditis belari TaxID=2138241 RepID=A0AAF3EUZ0_9BILA
MRSLLPLLCVASTILAVPRYVRYDAANKEIKEKLVAEIVNETLEKKTKAQKEDFEVEGFGCDLCLKTIYSINYNIAQMKSSAEDMVKKDCEALFGGDNEAVGTCVTLMIDKIEEYYEKIEPMIDTKNLCVRIGMCVRKENSTTTIPTTPNSKENSSQSPSSTSSEKSSSSSKSSEESKSIEETTSKSFTPESSTKNSILAKVEKVFADLF